MRAFGFVAAAVLLSQAGAAVAQSVLPEGMAVHLATSDEISSKTAKKGDQVNFVVREPVVIGGVTMIPAGSPAVGEVARARDNGLLGRSGKLEIAVSHVTVDGREIPVRGDRDKKGASGTLGVVGAAVVFLPLGIFIRGREARIAAGTPVDVYVAREIPMEAAPPPAPVAQQTPAAQPSRPQVMSVPIPASEAGPMPD
jgi:hypothetical protein